MMNIRRALAGACVLALAASACGGSEGASEEDAALIDALAAEWTDGGEFPESISTDCLAKGFIDGIGGAEGATGYGITPDNVGDGDFEENPLSEDDARAAASNMFACDGLKSAILSEMGSEVTDDQAKCLSDNVDTEPLEALIASTFMGPNGAGIESEMENTFEEDFFGAFTECEIEF